MILDELAAYLATTGVGYSTVGTDIFKGFLPDTPDSCLSVYEYAGLPSQKAMQLGAGQAVVERPRVQITCRGTARDYSTPRSNAKTVWQRLDGLGAQDMSAITYLFVEALGSPFELMRDENERVVIACNYQVQKRAS